MPCQKDNTGFWFLVSGFQLLEYQVNYGCDPENSKGEAMPYSFAFSFRIDLISQGILFMKNQKQETRNEKLFLA
jgi:hypothetical protein